VAYLALLQPRLQESMSVSSPWHYCPVAQKKLVSPVIYHYTINLLILYKKTFLKEVKVGAS